ncbi:MAG TPA: hypothetical protein VI968_03800 [archaeon]|nr:hypothetical protein [archaeon]
MEERVFYIDLDVVELFGFAKEVSDLCVESMMRGIGYGDDFDAVVVEPVGPLSYKISHIQLQYRGEKWLDGGNIRAVSHYIAGKKLKVRLPTPKDSVRKDAQIQSNISIRDMIVKNDKPYRGKNWDLMLSGADPEYDIRKRFYENYR